MNQNRNDKFQLASKSSLLPPQTSLIVLSASPSASPSAAPSCSPIHSNGICTSEVNFANSSSGSLAFGPANETLATSSSSKFTLPSNGGKREGNGASRNEMLCTDRKGFIDHLRPKSLVLSSCRVTIIQAAQLLSTYLTDQLEHESDLDEQLSNDQITQLEYESSLLEFEENEWKKRWNEFFYSNKLYTAIGKFHLLTLIIRSYESLLWNVVKVDAVFMDKVTKDTYKVAVRKANELNDYRYYGSRRSSSSSAAKRSRQTQKLEIASPSKENEVTSTLELGKQMFTSCFYANAITFFADLTVQQCILLYGYYKFFVSKERERKLFRLRKKYEQELKLNQGRETEIEEVELLNETKEAKETESSKDENDKEEKDDESETTMERNISQDASIAPWMEDEKAIIMLSFLRRSAQNGVMKTIGLVFASLGGAIGSMIYPGWGTLFGTQMGDAAIGALLDE